ncbi:MAG: DMT family transporter [Sedimentisphaerales bacterium]|nr:DMT family transporter [Sedimentisphaerales bacterium]
MSDHINIKKVDFTATFETLGTLLFWTLGPIFITYLAGQIDSYTQNFLRYLTACLFLIPFLIFSIRKNNFDKRIWLKALFPAAANLTMQSLYAAGFYYISPGFLILILKLSIIWTALFSLIFFSDEKPLAKSKRFWFGMILSIVGVFGVTYFKQDFAETKTITGICLAIGAGLAFAIYAISARIAFKRTDSLQAFTVTSIYTTIGLAVLTFSLGNIKQSASLNTWQWVCVVISGITGIAFGHPLYYAAMRRIGATIPSLILLAQPFTVLAMSYFIFKESMNVPQLLSGVVLLGGSAIAIWAQQHLKK